MFQWGAERWAITMGSRYFHWYATCSVIIIIIYNSLTPAKFFKVFLWTTVASSGIVLSACWLVMWNICTMRNEISYLCLFQDCWAVWQEPDDGSKPGCLFRSDVTPRGGGISGRHHGHQVPQHHRGNTHQPLRKSQSKNNASPIMKRSV